MNRDEITQLVQQMITDSQTVSQYSVGPTSSHSHNGVDSPRLKLSDIGIISGVVSVGNGFGNRGIITDLRVQPSSIIVVSPQSQNQATAISWLAACFNGSAEIFVNSGISLPPVIFNYIIIL